MADDVERLLEEYHRRRAAYVQAQEAFSPVRRQYESLLWQYNRLVRLRDRLLKRSARAAQLSRILFPAGWVVIAAAAAAGFSTLVIAFAELPTVWYLTVAIATALVGYVVHWWFRSGLSARDEVPKLNIQIDHLGQLCAQVRPEYERLKAQLEQAEREFRAIEGQVNHQVLALLNSPWQTLAGRDFERFVLRAFQVRGYRAELTTQARDQGVDILATAPDGRRIAVEVKGYPSGNAVGNDVVLKVCGGMGYWGCDKAVVVTNSRFTKSAWEAARRTGCVLIDAQRLPAFIVGKFDI